MNLLSILLQAPLAESTQQGGGWMQMVMIGLIVVVFYFFMIRPQMKRAKEQKNFRESLQKGQKIVTIGGIHGKIISMDEQTATIEVAHEIRLVVEKSAIASSIADQLNETTAK